MFYNFILSRKNFLFSSNLDLDTKKSAFSCTMRRIDAKGVFVDHELTSVAPPSCVIAANTKSFYFILSSVFNIAASARSNLTLRRRTNFMLGRKIR